MISIVTWNIQCGLGCDGRIDLERISSTLRGFGDTDVICLQEVARNMPELDQGVGDDQVKVLADMFVDHEPVFGAAINRLGQVPQKRRQFGNLILSRLPVIQVFAHQLPQPSEPSIRHMPRQVTEVVVRAEKRAIRVMTTHLEYHSLTHRRSQIDAVRCLHQQNCANVKNPGIDPGSGPYAITDRPEQLVICGDFNFSETEPEYQQIQESFGDGTPPLIDAWVTHKGDIPHVPTCGIFDRNIWPQGPHCRDFFFISSDLAADIQSIEVDDKTDASDHQPVHLSLNY